MREASDDLFVAFNSVLANKLLVSIEEPEPAVIAANERQLRSLVTHDRYTHTSKGVDAVGNVENRFRFLATTNDLDVFPADRRFPVLTCSETKRLRPPEECSQCMAATRQCEACQGQPPQRAAPQRARCA